MGTMLMTFSITGATEDIKPMVYTFHIAHLNFPLGLENEGNNKKSFLETLLHRRNDGYFQLLLHRKAARNGDHIHFHSFVSVEIMINRIFHY